MTQHSFLTRPFLSTLLLTLATTTNIHKAGIHLIHTVSGSIGLQVDSMASKACARQFTISSRCPTVHEMYRPLNMTFTYRGIRPKAIAQRRITYRVSGRPSLVGPLIPSRLTPALSRKSVRTLFIQTETTPNADVGNSSLIRIFHLLILQT